MAVPYTFGSATTSIPLSQLDSNFATTITLGNTAIQLGNTVTTLNNMTFANATVSSGNVTVLNATVTNDASISGLTVGKGGGSVSTNTAVGASALAVNTTGVSNTAMGESALGANTTGSNNTAVGYQAGIANTTGRITAFGHRVLYSNTTGTGNVGVGGNDGSVASALLSNTTGGNNTAVGTGALLSNTSASNNTAVGYQAGYNNTTGSPNTYLGYQAGYTGTAIAESVFIGNQAGYTTTASYTTMVGHRAGYACTTGARNVLVGHSAGSSLTTGGYNTFIGPVIDAGTGSGGSMTTGSKNTIIGGYSGNQGGLDIRTSSNYIVLSDGDGNPRFYHNGTYWTSTQLLVPYIYATTGAGAGTVVVGTDGNLFRSSSSARYKKDIVDARYGLSDLLKLRAVNYKGNGEQDTDKLLGGLIAEEVDEAGLQEFVIYDDQQRPDALHYAQMVSLCVKSIQELKALVDAQATEIAELKAKVA